MKRAVILTGSSLGVVAALLFAAAPAMADRYDDVDVSVTLGIGDLSVTVGTRDDYRYRYRDDYHHHGRNYDRRYCETYRYPYTHQHCTNDGRYDHRLSEREHRGHGHHGRRH